MNFAVVELKYVEKGIHIVPIKNIQSSKPKPSAVDPYFCYISSVLTDEPDFDAKYCEKFDGSPGLFRVFIKKITKTYEEAANFLKEKRMQTVPKKLRQPSNTDSELKAAAAKKKRIQKRVQKENRENASTKNSSHLAKLLLAVDSDSLTIASKFEDLVKRTLEDSSNSDSEIDSSTENSPPFVEPGSNDNSENAHESNLHENQRQPIELSDEIALPSASASNSVPLIVNCHSLGQRKCSNPKPLQQLNQIEQSKASSSNHKNCVTKSYKAAKIPIFNLSNDANPMNRMNKKPHVQPIVRKPDLTNALPLSLSANAVGTNKSVVAAPKMLAGSKEKQDKRKMHAGDDVFKLAQKPKIVHTDASQTKIGSPAPNAKVVVNVSGVINIDEMIIEKETLAKENMMLKERNDLLQGYLVNASKSAPQVPFEEVDGGRRYQHNAQNVFLNSDECKILDTFDNHRAYLNYLLLAVFTAETLKKSSVTGRSCNRTKAAGSTALDPTKLKFIYDLMAGRTNNSKEFNRSQINIIISKKIANLRAVGNPRKRRKGNVSVIVDDLDLQDDNSELDEEFGSFEMDNNTADSHDTANSIETSESANLYEPTNTSEHANPPEPFNTETPHSVGTADPAYNYNESSFITSDNNFGDDYLMYNINDLNLVDHSAFQNTESFVYIENAEGQPGQYVYLPK